MSRVLVAGGSVQLSDGAADVDILVEDGVIAEIGPRLTSGDAQILDASNCIVGPGLVDLHAHLGEPGHEDAETIASATRAAVLGGYTAVVAMPDTLPIVDCAAAVRHVQALASTALCQVEIAGAVTSQMAGEQLVPMAEMAELGVKMFVDAGVGVQDDLMMRRALEYSSSLPIRIAQHCLVKSLSANGHMHEGEWSGRLGIPGIPAEAEEIMVMRDIALSRLTDSAVHFQHLTTAGSMAMVAAARAQGLPITAEVAPAWFTLTDEACANFDAVTKVMPPLRSEADRAAVEAALHAMDLDAIVSAHTPHAPHTKDQPIQEAPEGMIGLQTALSLTVDQLNLSWDQLFALMSTGPARIAGIADHHGGPLAAGRPANIVAFDPKASWVVQPETLASLSRNTPFVDRLLTGRVRHTVAAGDVVVMNGEATR